mgnify:CR=1 FL=1
MTDQPPPPAAPTPAAPLSEAEDRQWASFAHLGGILYLLPALIIFLVFKDRGSFVRQESKEALNWQITFTIVNLGQVIVFSVLGFILLFALPILGSLVVGIPWFLWFALSVVNLIFSILGFVKAKDGTAYRYPVSLRLIK